MHPDMDKLLELQRYDDAIRAFDRQKAELPARVAAIDAELAGEERGLREMEDEIKRLEQERRDIETDIAQALDKINKARTRVSEVHNTKEYNAVLKELASAEKKNREREEAVLEIMQEAEDLRRARAERERAFGQKTHDLGEERAAASRTIAELDGRIGEARRAREGVAAAVQAKVLRQYEFLAGRLKGGVVSIVESRRCTACHMSIAPQTFNELVGGDQLHVCTGCRRILYVPPEAAAEANAAAAEAKSKIQREGWGDEEPDAPEAAAAVAAPSKV